MLDVVISLAIGILAGLGVGSGGLLVVYLTSFDGMEQRAAQGMNLAFFVFALGAAVLVHLRRRDLSLPILAVIISVGGVGAVLGALTAGWVDTDLLRIALGVLLLIMGGTSLLKR